MCANGCVFVDVYTHTLQNLISKMIINNSLGCYYILFQEHQRTFKSQATACKFKGTAKNVNSQQITEYKGKPE